MCLLRQSIVDTQTAESFATTEGDSDNMTFLKERVYPLILDGKMPYHNRHREWGWSRLRSLCIMK